MKNITIVTAFFDIGRGTWTPDKGLPHYLHRSNDTYLERFGYLAQMDHEMVIFTSQENALKVLEYRKGKEDKTKVVVLEHPRESHAKKWEAIYKVQQSSEFKNKLTPHQRMMPEAWSPDFNLVTGLKAYFTNQAIEMGLVSNNIVSWIDFGYARSPDKIPTNKKWYYDFDESKIHLFDYKDLGNRTVAETIYQGDVVVFGAFVVAHKNLWPKMSNLMDKSFDMLIEQNVTDDDQGLWLQASLLEPEYFELHRIPDHQLGHDPFVLFQQFNELV